MILLFWAAFSTLCTELTLIKIYDVQFYPQFSFLIISISFFGFGLASVPLLFKQRLITKEVDFGIWVSLSLALSNAGIIIFIKTANISIDFLNLSFKLIGVPLLITIFLSALPFVILGYVIGSLFQRAQASIAGFYLADLLGAGFGVLTFPFLIKYLGADSLLLFANVPIIIYLFLRSRTAIVRIINFFCLFILFLTYSKFANLTAPTFTLKWMRNDQIQHIENTYWDTLGRLDVVRMPNSNLKYIFYDGGTISTPIYRFDGDFKKLLTSFEVDPEVDFGRISTLASHWLRKSEPYSTYQIGVGAGQETKAALMFGAARIVGVDVNGRVLQLLKGPYADYSGNIFNHPKVEIHNSDGRRFLESNSEKFDVIQMFAAYQNAGALSGTGMLEATYLYTTEAFQLYFSRLNVNGILHLNVRLPERLLATAGKAWGNLGRKDFGRHVVLIEEAGDSLLPTTLLKMSPWTQGEVSNLIDLFERSKRKKYKFLYHPFLGSSYSSSLDDALSGDISAVTSLNSPVSLIPPTDDRPFYFNHFNPKYRGNSLTLDYYEKKANLPIHYISLKAWSFYSGFVLFVILILMSAFTRGAMVFRDQVYCGLYFVLLGIGFIGVQYNFLYRLIRLFDTPTVGYAVVLGGMLLLQGLGGGLLANKIKGRRIEIVFFGLLLFYEILIYFLGTQIIVAIGSIGPLSLRVIVSVIFLAPISVMCGVLFPLGVREFIPAGAVDHSVYIVKNWILNCLAISIAGLYFLYFFKENGFTSGWMLVCLVHALIIAIYLLARWKRGRSMQS